MGKFIHPPEVLFTYGSRIDEPAAMLLLGRINNEIGVWAYCKNSNQGFMFSAEIGDTERLSEIRNAGHEIINFYIAKHEDLKDYKQG